jgi:PAS domain S-box-containing protein
MAAAAAVADGLALIAVEAGPRFRYVYVNDAGVRMSGFSRAEMVGHCIDELLAPDDVRERARLWGEVARSGRPVTHRLSISFCGGATGVRDDGVVGRGSGGGEPAPAAGEPSRD